MSPEINNNFNHGQMIILYEDVLLLENNQPQDGDSASVS